MIIEICSQAKALEKAGKEYRNEGIISVTSTDQKDVYFSGSDLPVFRLRVNDLTQEYDEEGIPYGRPLPTQEDFTGLRKFVSGLQCDHLIIHCWEGTSRSAAVAAAVFEFRGCVDTFRTCQPFAPNLLVYELACRELGIKQGNLQYTLIPKTEYMQLIKRV